MTSSTSHVEKQRRPPERSTLRPPGPASLNAAQPNLNRLSLAETPLPLPGTSSTVRSILPASASVSSFAGCTSRYFTGRSDRAGGGHDGDFVYVLVSGQQVGWLRGLSVRSRCVSLSA